LKVLILAGGVGSRLRPYSDFIPKCLMPIRGVPCVRLIIEDILKEMGDAEIVLCINERFEEHFRHEFRDLNIDFSVSPEPKGTAGEIAWASHKLSRDEPFMVVYGDDLTHTDYKAFIAFHNSSHEKDGSVATLLSTMNVPLEFGVLDIENGFIKGIREKPPLGQPIWTGKCILEYELVNLMKPGLDLAKHIFPQLLRCGLKICSYVTDNLWLDIGSIGHYDRANEIWEER